MDYDAGLAGEKHMANGTGLGEETRTTNEIAMRVLSGGPNSTGLDKRL